MESDPGIVLLGAVVLLLAAILIGVVYATRDRTQPREEELDALRREIGHLREDNERLRHGWRRWLDEFTRIAELLRRQPP
jgi:Tfp pilus assembly protein PilN